MCGTNFLNHFKTRMERNSLRGNLATIADIVFFLVEWSWTSDHVFFFTQRPFLASVVFLTLHDTLLTTRGRRGFFFFFFCFFMMSSNVDDPMWFMRGALNVHVVRIFQHARVNGRSNYESL